MKVFIKTLVIILAMAGIAAIGFGAYKIVQQKMDEKWEEERVSRVLEVEESTTELRETIASLSKEDVEKFIEDNVNVAVTEKEQQEIDAIENLTEEELVDPWADKVNAQEPDEKNTDEGDQPSSDGLESDGQNLESDENNQKMDDEKSVNDEQRTDEGEQSSQYDEKNTGDSSDEKNTGDSSDSSDENWESGSSKENVSRVADLGYDAVSQAFSTSGNSLKDDSVSGNSLSDNSLSDNSLSDNSLSDNSLSQNSIDGTVSGNTLTLKYRQKFRSSDEETKLWAEADQETLDNTELDFSQLKIACLGDSVTAGSNMDDEPDYQDYTYPTRLREALNAESVTNLGIGGSSLGRYWDQAFCDRYQEIPEDTDLIIVMGGYNDGYCLHEDMVGSLEEREPRTLYGDVNDLFAGLKENYPNAEVIVVTPLPNLLHDVLRSERPELLPQTVIIDCLKELADEYEFKVIDDYNSNFFDSHDPEIVADYIPDSVHPNQDGYELLAKHIAAEIVRIKEDENSTDEDEEGKDISDEDKKGLDEEGKDISDKDKEGLDEENQDISDEDKEGLDEEKSEDEETLKDNPDAEKSENDKSEDEKSQRLDDKKSEEEKSSNGKGREIYSRE